MHMSTLYIVLCVCQVLIFAQKLLLISEKYV